jgi:hypothetical protein
LEKIKAVPAIIQCNWYEEDLDYVQTLKRLEKEGFLHPCSQFGEKLDLLHTPHKIYFMASDIYLDLVRKLIRKEAIGKSQEIHAENKWADYLRLHIPLLLVTTDFDKAVEMSIPLCKLDAAKGLPGFLR